MSRSVEEKLVAHLVYCKEWWKVQRGSREVAELTVSEVEDLRRRVYNYVSLVPDCEHSEQFLVWWRKRNNNLCYSMQCSRCFKKTSDVKRKNMTEQKAASAVERIRPDYSKVIPARDVAYAYLLAEVDTLRTAVYNRYMGSVAWKQTRSHVLARANGKCEMCGARDATEVHHLTYDRLGAELLSDLAAVCKECHDLVHPSHPLRNNG